MISRRTILGAAAAAGTLSAQPQFSLIDEVSKLNDATVERLLKAQNTDPSSRWRGGYPDGTGLYYAGSGSSILEYCTASFVHPASKFHKDRQLVERMTLAAGFLERVQTPDGNFNLLTTNFNSPPDTGFIVRSAASAAAIAQGRKELEIFRLMEPFLRKAGAALAVGGIHTPNHRWVVSAALAQLHAIFNEPGYVKRVDQWLAEGIDIDEDGQYTERSTTVYNSVSNTSLLAIAMKLRRPELLEPVRRNLDASLYLLHPGYEIVTEISRRQDLNLRGDPGNDWWPYLHLARVDGNGQFETLGRHFAQQRGRLSPFLEYPELLQVGPVPAAVPDQYERVFPHIGFARFRRGLSSATLLWNKSSRFFQARRGDCVLNAVRFASAFFGKGQFAPAVGGKAGQCYTVRQTLEGPYYQPLDPARKVGTEDWAATRRERRQSEVCRLEQSATLDEIRGGFRLRLRAEGTDDVPVAVELNFREGGRLEGGVAAPKLQDAWMLEKGDAVYRTGGGAVRFGPGRREHSYIEVRGAETKLAGPSVYLTGFTPFDHTLTLVFE